MELDLSFKEAIFGCKKEIKIRYKDACPDCKAQAPKKAKSKPALIAAGADRSSSVKAS